MQITINTNEELSPLDIQVLALLTNGSAPTIAATPAKAAAPAKKTAAAKPAPEPEPEPEAEEDLLGGDEKQYTMADAVALATKLVSAGEAAKVKAALTDAGAKRVSELPEDAIAGFITALDGD